MRTVFIPRQSNTFSPRTLLTKRRVKGQIYSNHWVGIAMVEKSISIFWFNGLLIFSVCFLKKISLIFFPVENRLDFCMWKNLLDFCP